MSLFRKAIHLAATKVLVDINDKCYHIAWELFTSVVEMSPSPANKSPYSKGLLANQWYPKAGSPSSEISSATSANGANSLQRINAMKGGTEFYQKDGSLYLTNNVPYSFRAEILGWKPEDNPVWKGASPYRMVARSLQKIAAKYKKG